MQRKERLHVYIAGFTPVEARMGDDDFCAGDEQGKKRDDRKPVGHADERGVAGCGDLQGRDCDGHRRRIARDECEGGGNCGW